MKKQSVKVPDSVIKLAELATQKAGFKVSVESTLQACAMAAGATKPSESLIDTIIEWHSEKKKDFGKRGRPAIEK